MKMPSDYERRRLAEIEAALRVSDPGLDRALRTFRPRRMWLMAALTAMWLGVAAMGLTRWWIVTLILLGPMLALTCVALRPRRRARTSSATDDGLFPPTSTRS